MRLTLFVVLTSVSPAGLASAQAWKDIGKTASNNVVSVNPKSIRKKDGKVSAMVRVVFTPPVKAARGMWASSTTSATFDCAARKLAAKENTFYSDVKSTKVIEKSVNKLPGYGPALGGSLGQIALDYLCSAAVR